MTNSGVIAILREIAIELSIPWPSTYLYRFKCRIFLQAYLTHYLCLVLKIQACGLRLLGVNGRLIEHQGGLL